jgi:hypothetical protein
MSLLTPSLVRPDMFPLRVVVGGIDPMHIIAEMELPVAINRDIAPANLFDGQRGYWTRFYRLL